MTRISRENPARPSEIVGSVETTDAAGVDVVVRRADAAQKVWGALSLDERRAALTVAADSLSPEVVERIGIVLSAELGKPIPDAKGEITFGRLFLQFCIENAPKQLLDEETDDATGRMLLRKVPYGVVAAITPWNAPIILSMLKVAPALVAGNAIVVKPSPQAPLAITEVVNTLAAHLPEGLLQIVHGDAETGEALITHPLVRKVAFTGGDVVARHIGAAAAQAITPTVMELGGNDAAIFLEDAVLDDGAYDRIVMASYATSGQVCMASKRIYVPRALHEQFVEGFIAAADRMINVGDPSVDGVTIGPVVSKAAQERLDKLAVESAEAGGEVREIGRIDDPDVVASGYFSLPRVVTGLTDDAKLVSEEQFGPIVPILAYDTVDEVIERANATDLGLGASVWSADEAKAFEVASRIEAGFTFINTHNRTGMALRAPFGGVKKSGFGREYGEEGLLEYVQTVTVNAPAAFRPGGSGGSASAYPV